MKACPYCGTTAIELSFEGVLRLKARLVDSGDFFREVIAKHPEWGVRSYRLEKRLVDFEVGLVKNLSEVRPEDAVEVFCLFCRRTLRFSELIEQTMCECGAVYDDPHGKITFCQKTRYFVCRRCINSSLCRGCEFEDCEFRIPGEGNINPENLD